MYYFLNQIAEESFQTVWTETESCNYISLWHSHLPDNKTCLLIVVSRWVCDDKPWIQMNNSENNGRILLTVFIKNIVWQSVKLWWVIWLFSEIHEFAVRWLSTKKRKEKKESTLWKVNCWHLPRFHKGEKKLHIQFMHWQTLCFTLCTIQRGYNKSRNQTNNKKFDVFNLHSINRLQAPGVEREAFLSKQKHICAQPKISSLQLGATTDCTMK